MHHIKKVDVATGITWVEVPEADLFLLCGCPADSVKHLMRRGLIVPLEDRGVRFESGPNAILLSDIMLQNGQFSNMAEFPVLQMLYRQGMIIPNHPHNTGQCPLLLGTKEQVEAQKRYIYRGNYGLVNEEELRNVGLTEAQAHEMMRMKLKFAFGAIKETDAFLESRTIADEAIEIRNGVILRRIAVNIFEISYNGEAVTVNLNLAPHEQYEPPYPLGQHFIKRDYFGVVHSGDGDGWDPNRPCMSSILMYQGRIFLVDAGPNIERSLISLGIGLNEIEGIFHTHSHDDHFAGLASLIRADRRIKYFATPLVRHSVVKKLCALLSIDESNFSHYFEVHDLEFDKWNSIEGLEVMPLFSPHPVENNLFVFRTLWEDGYRTFAHYADTISFTVLDGMTTEDEHAAGVSPTFAERVKADYLRPADLKKIDIGGGMIHGNALDFINDKSSKMLLCHTARTLDAKERQIGSGAPFGTVDTLIPSYQDYTLRLAWEFLSIHLPKAPTHALRMLLNGRIEIFNPESIILKVGQVPDDLYLILTGTVETLTRDTGHRSHVYAGTLIGERSGFAQIPSSRTYRAASFVQALKIPTTLYREFISSHNMVQDIERLRDFREFLDNTHLFNDGISHATRNHIAQDLQTNSYRTGHIFKQEELSCLFLIRHGRVNRYVGDELIDELGVGSFFGEEVAIFKTKSLFKIVTQSDVELYCIPGDRLEDIPIVRWKLYEVFERLMQNLNRTGKEALQ
ncbi:cyclic nucleotide-binding protein [Magnetococcus marinus MC-1]|uniref:Cyclic nucleotide-binding protein n=1 Tax=Magnetococcus marinus (strain ATCC BAA-1437 / JCM 17883 / MC-1) TaxID=156889 RepID=A0L8F0_MAGMM|nr:cyclic nucleotide-binding domain-containing protein [Magnetococcus marinus]ABK44243.1 cyclic nucleotide-binding protein [Magnetococcus marinus MC-1]